MHYNAFLGHQLVFSPVWYYFVVRILHVSLPIFVPADMDTLTFAAACAICMHLSFPGVYYF